MPLIDIRNEQDFFYDFFRDAQEFIDFVKENILGYRENDSKEIKDKYINDDFIRIFYYGFKRRYRNVIVYEQEWFYDDFIYTFADRKRKFELLYSLWIEENEEDPFNMINLSNERTALHTGSDNKEEKSLSSNESYGDSKHKANDGQIQGRLTIEEVGDKSTPEYATNVSLDKNSSQNKANGENQAHSNNESKDIVKSQMISKTSVIFNFTRQDLREGFQQFIETFNNLFSKLPAHYNWNWNGYRETVWDEIPMDDKRPPITIIPNIMFNNSVINLYQDINNTIEILNYEKYNSISLKEIVEKDETGKDEPTILTLNYSNGVITIFTNEPTKKKKAIKVTAKVPNGEKTAEIIVNINPNLTTPTEIWVDNELQFEQDKIGYLSILNWNKLGKIILIANTDKISAEWKEEIETGTYKIKADDFNIDANGNPIKGKEWFIDITCSANPKIKSTVYILVTQRKENK